MIPDSPNWTSITAYLAYPEYSFPKPTPPKDTVFTISVGPQALGDSQGRLDQKYWLLTYEAGQFYIDGQALFAEEFDVIRCALTFDQLGRPIVFYHTFEPARSIDKLKVYWYDPVEADYRVIDLARGWSPVAGFDMVKDVGVQYSDAMLFYIRDDRAYMRVQRERFEIEHPTPLTRPKLELLYAAMRLDYRFQVQARVPSDKAVGFDWTPEEKVSRTWTPEHEVK